MLDDEMSEKEARLVEIAADITEREAIINDNVSKKGVKNFNRNKAATLKAEQKGLSVQKLHKGSYDEEEESLSLLFSYMQENNLEMNGRHRELYLNDPRETAVDDLRTIIRYAVKSSL